MFSSPPHFNEDSPKSALAASDLILENAPVDDMPTHLRSLLDPASSLPRDAIHLPIKRVSWLYTLCLIVPVATLFAAAAVNHGTALPGAVAWPVALAAAAASGVLTWLIVRGLVTRLDSGRPRSGVILTDRELALREPGANLWVLPRHRVHSASVRGRGKNQQLHVAIGWTDDDGDHRTHRLPATFGTNLEAIARAVSRWCTGNPGWTSWAFPANEAAQAAEFIVVDVRNQGLRALADPGFPLRALRRLVLRGNPLQELPAHLSDLDLRALDVADTGLERLPDWIGGMSGLRALDLRDNALRRLPESLVQLQQLETLYLGGNSFESWPGDDPPSDELMLWLLARPEAIATRVGVDLLARFGNIESVDSLRAVVASRRYESTLRLKAEEAVERIRARAPHAEAGRLSLVVSRDSEGGLSLLEEKAIAGDADPGDTMIRQGAAGSALRKASQPDRWWWLMLRRSPLALLLHLLLLAAGVNVAAVSAARLSVQTRELDRLLQSVVVLPEDSTPDPAHEGALVHLTGRLRGSQLLSDDLFGVQASAIWMIRRVEMYQWQERVRRRESGGQQVKRYRYDRVWSRHHLRSTDYHDQSRVNPPSIPWQREPWYADEVRLGGFRLSREKVSNLRGDAVALIGHVDVASRVEFLSGGWQHRVADSFLHLSRGRPSDPDDPQIGDLRISWPILSARAEASILARQAGNGFAPLRPSPLLRSGGSGGPPSVHAIRTGRHSVDDLLRPVSSELTGQIVGTLLLALLLNLGSMGALVKAFSACGYAVAADRVPVARMTAIGGSGLLAVAFGILATAWLSGWWLTVVGLGLGCLVVVVILARRSALVAPGL